MERKWQVTGATMATQMAQAGLLIYGFSALALPLQREFGASMRDVALATTCLSLASSFGAPLAGRLIDHWSIRKLMLLGAAMLALGFGLVSQAQQLWQVWLAYALILPMANLLLGQLTSAALITRWFTARRGSAMGLSALGTSLGGFVFPVLLTALSTVLGWRMAVALIALAAAVVVAGIVYFVVDDGPHPAKGSGQEAGPQISAFTILARPAFWIITLAVGIKIATYFGLINNLAAYAGTLEVNEFRAATLVSTLSLASMAGKLGFGYIADRAPLKWLFFAALVLTVVSFGVLLVASGYPSLFAACLMLGLATGGMLPMWSLIVAEQLGEAGFGRAMGLTNLFMVPLTASAAPLAGWAFDTTGSYQGVILASMAVLAVAALLVLALKPQQVAA